MTETAGSRLPLREVAFECKNCGSEKRRPNSNHCAGCGRFAPDAKYGRGAVTGQWYRVTEYEDLGDGKLIAKSKQEVDRDEVPQHVLNATEERGQR